MPITLIPPPEFDKPVPAVEYKLTLQEMLKFSPCGQGFKGCSQIMMGQCVIWLLAIGTVADDGKPVTQAFQNAQRRHEKAHCHGWPKDHPNGTLFKD